MSILLHTPRAYNGKTYDVLTIEQRHSDQYIPLLEPGTAFSTPLHFRWTQASKTTTHATEKRVVLVQLTFTTSGPRAIGYATHLKITSELHPSPLLLRPTSHHRTTRSKSHRYKTSSSTCTFPSRSVWGASRSSRDKQETGQSCQTLTTTKTKKAENSRFP